MAEPAISCLLMISVRKELGTQATTDVAPIKHMYSGRGGEMALLTATWTRKRLVARAAVLAVVAVRGLTVAAPANAQQATHLAINIDDTFESDLLTEACGTTVVISNQATLNVTL